MKKLFLIFSVCLAFTAISQTCEQRESKLIQGIAGFSAAYLYNTYAVIGSLSDGFGNDIYTAKSLTDLLSAQNKVIDHLASELEKMSAENILHNQQDKKYANTTVAILRSLKKQAELMIEYARSKTPQRLEAYETQRNKNWEEISKLMGIAG